MSEHPINPDGTPGRNGYIYTHEGVGMYMDVVHSLNKDGLLVGHLDMIDYGEEIWEYSYSSKHHVFMVLRPKEI